MGTQKYLKVPKCTSKYPKVPQSTQKYLEVPKSTSKYPKVPQSTQKYLKVPKVPQSTSKYPKVPQSTQKYLNVFFWTHILTKCLPDKTSADHTFIKMFYTVRVIEICQSCA